MGNESPADVYFDDVAVVHGQGLQVQETEYDPTGLELAGLGSSTPGLKPLNQYKFNGQEFQADLGLNWNHQDWRFFDAQLGRWHVVDPEAESGDQEGWSTYQFGFNNAVRYEDADGRCPTCPDAGTLAAAWQEGVAAGEATVASPAAAMAPLVVISVATVAIIALSWDKLPSADQINQRLGGMRVGARNSAAFGNTHGYGQMPTTSAKDANGRVNASHKNRIPDTGTPNSVDKNAPGTTHKKYGPDGVVQKEFNKAHRAPGTPKKETSDHVHDHIPKPDRHPKDPQPTNRQPGRPPKPNELLKDFGIKQARP